MSIQFKNKNDRTSTKEDIKLHIIENLIEKRFNAYNNVELRDAMIGGTFKKIYNEIIERVFN